MIYTTSKSEHLRFRLRMCIWKQWKNGKTRVTALRKLGMTPWQARRNGHSSKGYARIALSWVMTTTVTNARLKQKGGSLAKKISREQPFSYEKVFKT